jgi:hypothetical protein
MTVGVYGGSRGFNNTATSGLYFITGSGNLVFQSGSQGMYIVPNGSYTDMQVIYGGNTGYLRQGTNFDIFGAGETRIGAGGNQNLLTILSGGNIGAGVTTPTSALHTTSFATAYVAKAVDYTATASDNIIKVTASGKTITLPTAVSISGRQYTVVNASSGNITVATTSSQTIGNFNTATTLTIASDGSYILASDGAGWIIKAKF